jgi:hypothetical protein
MERHTAMNKAQATKPPVLTTRTIKTTPENAKEVQQLVKNDPALLALVQSLQASGLFPGLRALSFTITGTPERCAQGLAAWGPAASPTEPQEAPCK